MKKAKVFFCLEYPDVEIIILESQLQAKTIPTEHVDGSASPFTMLKLKNGSSIKSYEIETIDVDDVKAEMLAKLDIDDSLHQGQSKHLEAMAFIDFHEPGAEYVFTKTQLAGKMLPIKIRMRNGTIKTLEKVENLIITPEEEANILKSVEEQGIEIL